MIVLYERKKIFRLVLCGFYVISTCFAFRAGAESAGGAEPGKDKQVQINVGPVLHESEIRIQITNKSNVPIRAAGFGSMGNTIYIKTPSGEVLEWTKNAKLPEDYKFDPDIIVDPGSTLIIKDAYKKYFRRIVDIMLRNKEPGKYVLWFDLISWIEFGKESRTYTSNKLVIFRNEETQ